MNQSNTKNNTGLLVFILLLILGLSGLLVYRYMKQSIKSDELPIKCDECYISYPIPQTLQYKERNKIIEIDSNEQSEETEYTYSYSKQDNEIKYYKDNTLVKTKSILFNDDKLFILKTDDDKIEIGSYKKMLNDILDYYKEEADIDVTGYYLDEDTEIYLTENKEIYFGSKEGIKKGTYEVLKFKSEYLSDPVINYTLEGKTKFANTHSIKYYNDTCLYIKNIDSKVLSKCPKYGDLCPPDKINTNLKSIEESELKYLKNIE